MIITLIYMSQAQHTILKKGEDCGWKSIDHIAVRA